MAPEDVIFHYPYDDLWGPSGYRGKLIPNCERSQFTYATARTDLPREAYADDEIRPMTAEECKALDEFTMAELRSEPTPDLTQPLSEIGQEQWEGVPDSEPGADVASERRNWGIEDTGDTLWVGPMRRDGHKVNEIVCKFDLEGLKPEYKAEKRKLANIIVQSVNHAGPQSDTIRGLESTIATLRAQLDAEQAKRKDTARDFETAFRLVREENDKLRAEVDFFKSFVGNEVYQSDYQTVGDMRKAITRLTAALDAKNRRIKELGTDLAGYKTELDAVRKKREALQRFKNWVHTYLDEHGVPHHPPGTHGAEGCRIGDRMDWLMAKLDAAQARCGELERVVQAAKRLVSNVYIDWHSAGGVNDCVHGYGEGIPCRKCDEATVRNALLTPSQQPDKEEIPKSFVQGMQDIEEGRTVSMEHALHSRLEPVKAWACEPINEFVCQACNRQWLREDITDPGYCPRCHNKALMNLPAPPIAPEGKATEGEG